MFKMKKILGLIASFGMVSSTVSAVVACGPVTLEKIENREVDNKTFKTSFSNSITTWNPVQTMQNNDIKLLSNLNDTLLTYNENNELVPLMTTDIGTPNDNNDAWTFTLRDDLSWFDYNGNVVGQITANDILNTAKFVLNPKNVSELVGNWTQFLKGAYELNDSLNKWIEKEEPTKQEILNSSIWDDFLPNMIEINDKDNKNPLSFTVHLSKPAPYFRSLLTTLTFSPTPFKALTLGIDYGKDYRNIYTTSGYLVQEYQPSYILTLRKNDNYFNSENIYIEKIMYNFLMTADAGKPRWLFESNDYNEVILQPADSKGWNKYVGNDPYNPKFKGVTTIKNPTLGTRNILYNYSNTDPIVGKNSNIALSLLSVRTLLTYSMDRSIFVKYFSGPYDNGSNTSKFLRNTLTPNNFVNNSEGVDYQELIQSEYNKMFASKDIKNVYDGNDIFLNNKDLIDYDQVLTNEKAKTYYDNEKYYEALLEQVTSDLKDNGINGKVTLDFLTSDVNKNTWNGFLQSMIWNFNNSKNPIQLRQITTTNDSEYQTRQIKGDYSMFLTGWSPLYKDPLAFLQSEQLNGDMAAYMGLNRLVKKIKYNNDNLIEEVELNEKYNNESINKMIDNFIEFTNALTIADGYNKTNQLDERYEKFAKAEVEMLYKYKLSLPSYIPDGTEKVMLTYLDVNTQSHIGFGSSDFRMINVKMFKHIIDKDKNRPNDDKKLYFIKKKITL